MTSEALPQKRSILSLLDPGTRSQRMGWIIVIYACLWSLAGILLDPTLPYDAVEAYHWGAVLEFGSPKNPYLVGAVGALGQWLPIPFPMFWYLSHFLAIAVGLWGCWRLCERLYAPSWYAPVAVLALSLTASINIDVIPYNDNYLLMMLWPFVWLYFIKAVYDDTRYWVALGIVMALATMAKYSTVIFLPFMLLAILVDARSRRSLWSGYLLLGLVLGTLLILPNLWWLSLHDFSAFHWFHSRVSGGFNLENVEIYLSVFYNLILLIPILMACGFRWHRPQTSEQNAFIFVAVAPIVFLFVYFTLKGGARTEWMMPFAMPASLSLMLCLRPSKPQQCRIPMWIFLGMSLLIWVGYSAVKWHEVHHAHTPRDKVAELSVELNAWWQERFHTPLSFAGGSRMGDWLSVYAPDHPKAPTRWSTDPYPNVFTPGLTDDILREKGALWVGSDNEPCGDGGTLEIDPAASAALKAQVHMEMFTFHDAQTGIPHFSVCVGVLPPGTPAPQ